MKIDFDEVSQGDQVWHDRYGYGIIQRVSKYTCDVKFNESTKVLTFTEGGYSGGLKVLWWQKPIAFIPRKGHDYSKFHELVSVLFDNLYGDK